MCTISSGDQKLKGAVHSLPETLQLRRYVVKNLADNIDAVAVRLTER